MTNYYSGVSPPRDDLLFSTAKKEGKNAALQRRLIPRPSGRSRTRPSKHQVIKKECRARTTRAANLPASGSALMGKRKVRRHYFDFLLFISLVFALGATGGRAGARCRPDPPRSGIGPWRPEAEGRDRKENRPGFSRVTPRFLFLRFIKISFRYLHRHTNPVFSPNFISEFLAASFNLPTVYRFTYRLRQVL